MRRTSFLRVAGLLLAAAASWVGCVDSDSATSEVPICTRYCDALTANCAGLEYKDRDQCLKACSFMKPGAENVVDDSVGCRLTQAKNATKDDKASCKKASAYGGTACGDPCTTFCRMVDQICITGSDAAASAKPYTSESSCFEQCKATPLTYDPNGDEGPQAFDGADTLNCRMFHLLLAMDDQVTHCPHAGLVSNTCRTR